MPGECASTPYVFSNVACFPSKRLALFANRNDVLVCEMATGKTTTGLSKTKQRRILNVGKMLLEQLVAWA